MYVTLAAVTPEPRESVDSPLPVDLETLEDRDLVETELDSRVPRDFVEPPLEEPCVDGRYVEYREVSGRPRLDNELDSLGSCSSPTSSSSYSESGPNESTSL